jgi:hypothetical protein
VDELVALGEVFEVPIYDLLIDPDEVDQKHVNRALEFLEQAHTDLVSVTQRILDGYVMLLQYRPRGAADTAAMIETGRKYLWEQVFTQAASSIKPWSRDPNATPIDTGALTAQFQQLHELLLALATDWLAAEDARLIGRRPASTPLLGSAEWWQQVSVSEDFP